METQPGEDRADDRLHGLLGALAYGFVVLRVAGWLLSPASGLAAGILLTGLIGLGGNVAYGFETIHLSLGDVPLVDQAGAANLIKPLGLLFPLSLALVALALARLGHRWQAALVLVAVVCRPIAHIGNVAAVAVPVNVALVLALGSLFRSADPTPALRSDPAAGRRSYATTGSIPFMATRVARGLHRWRRSRRLGADQRAPSRSTTCPYLTGHRQVSAAARQSARVRSGCRGAREC